MLFVLYNSNSYKMYNTYYVLQIRIFYLIRLYVVKMNKDECYEIFLVQ